MLASDPRQLYQHFYVLVVFYWMQVEGVISEDELMQDYGSR